MQPTRSTEEGKMIRRSLCWAALLTATVVNLSAQEDDQSGTGSAVSETSPATSATPPATSGTRPATEDKRILWFFTNHRTTGDSEEQAKTLTPRGKFAIAWDDATDRAIFLQSAFLSGIGQASNSNPSFGQGVAGYAKRFGTTYTDFAVENITTEGVFPVLFHQDPRYFRRGEGSTRSRLMYAMSRLFITRGDSGKSQFNYSEIVGAATSVAISNAYYPDGRTVGNAVTRYGEQLGFDAASNVLKEFWPSLKRKLPRRLRGDPQ
jgi:hypothetical protein